MATNPRLDKGYTNARKKGPKAAAAFIKAHPLWAKSAGLTVKNGKPAKAGPPKPSPAPKITLSIGGSSYTVNRNTGVIRDASGAIVIGATYDPKTGAVTVGGQTVDATPRRTPIAGQSYDRNFANKANWTQATDPATGATYYVNKRNGNVFTTDGVFVARYRNGKFNFFDAGTPGQPDAEQPEPPADAPPMPTSPLPEGWDWTWDPDASAWVPEQGESGVDAKERRNILDLLSGFLRENELPSTLLGFIQSALSEGKSYQQIIAELRETAEYKAAYPENEVRKKKGFSWMPEAQIRQYRNDARRIAKMSLGIDVSNREIAGLISGDVSLSEWEQRLTVWKKFEQFGPTVRAVLEAELGTSISDDRVFAFLNNEIPTPELDQAYENALYRGRPAILGLGVRPEDEANILRRYGVDVDQAFRGYQGIVAEMPRAERLSFIDRAVSGNPNLPANGSALFNDTPFATLFRAIQLNDGEALRTLQEQMQREIARNAQGGGVAFQGGIATGLTVGSERAPV